MALRKNMRRRYSRDMRGKITCGTKSEKGYPKSLDHFNVSKFPELAAVYGDKPQRIAIFFPSNNIEDFFFTEYSLWGGKGDSAVKKRKCDGETACDLSTGEEKACFCASLPEKQQCKSYTSLKAYVADINTGQLISPMLYQFETHSDNSSDGLYTEIENVFNMTGGRLVGVPFCIEVKFIKKLGGKQFPILHLQSVNNLEAIHALASRGVLPAAPQNSLAIDITGETPTLSGEVKAIEAPAVETVKTVDLTATIALLTKDKKTPADQKQLIGDMITLLVDGNMAQAGSMLEKLTGWSMDDGTPVRGYESMREINELSGQKLNIAYGKVKAAFTKAFKKQIDEYAAEEVPA